MNNLSLRKFAAFKVESAEMIYIKGGLCACKAAAPYSCEAGGYTVGTHGFNRCMGEIYSGCDSIPEAGCAVQ